MPNKSGHTGVIKFGKEQRGGISIFLSIIMIAVIILTGLLVDVARVSSAKNQTARALDIAAVSVLAGFDTVLRMALHSH